MKNFLFLATLFWNFPAFAAEPPRQSLIDLAQDILASSLEKEQKLLLSQYLPGIFPIHFLCQFKGLNKDPITVFPGDWIDTVDAGELNCPGLLAASVDGQSRIRVNQYGKRVGVLLEKGRITMRPTSEPFFLETTSLRLGAVATGKATQLGALASDTSQSIGCIRGSVLAELEAADEASGQKQFLFSHACRAEIKPVESEITYYLNSQDLVEAQNLSLSRRAWPNPETLPANPFINSPVVPQSVSLLIKPATTPDTKLQAHWSIPPNLLTAPGCTVYAQTEEGKAAKEVSRFEAKELQGDFTLDAAYAGKFLALVCEDTASTFASAVVF